MMWGETLEKSAQGDLKRSPNALQLIHTKRNKQMTATYTEQINILIAETLEQLQDLNPELYGEWYSKLYAPFGAKENWTVANLHQIEQAIIDCAS
jgi:hypothetical protein